jgi:stage IV sporulation protein FB
LGWQDRDYYRERPFSSNPLLWLVSGSLPLFTFSGIRVRMHASMLVFIGLTLLLSGIRGGLGVQNAVVSMTILFNSVLLHEFGHCFACRWVGGDASDILMWPLGGLASLDPPHRPLPSFISTAGGPAVNLGICIITGAALGVLNHSINAIPWFPFRNGLLTYVPYDWTTYYLWWIFLVNYALLVFNLLMVFYPFDGGRMVQEILWAFVGYYRSMQIAVVTGIIGAAVVLMIGFATWSLFLILIAGFGLMACIQQRRMLLEMGPYGFSEYDNGGSFDLESARRTNRRAVRNSQRAAQRRRTDERKIDRILAKVSAQGMHSLTWWEKRTLRKGSQRKN